MNDPHVVDPQPCRPPGPLAVGAYTILDLLDRIWRRWQRTLDKAVVAWDTRRT